PAALQRSTTSGEPAELFLILPPNLEQAIARGKIMVCFEAKWSRGRIPLNALPANQLFRFSSQDITLLDRIEVLAAGQIPAMLMLAADDFASLLPALVNHERVTLGKNTAIQILDVSWTLSLRAELQTNGEIVLSLSDNFSPPALVGNWVWQNPVLQPIGIPKEHLSVLQSPVRIPRA